MYMGILEEEWFTKDKEEGPVNGKVFVSPWIFFSEGNLFILIWL
jgi:hypothetical protein